MGIELLDKNDLAKLGCNDCNGCSDCCKGMGTSVILDPYDIVLLKYNLELTFEQLIGANKIELNMQEGLILPSIAMNGKDESCAFLNQDGRCSIHSFRPGLCRLFPLGRDYSSKEVKYFVLDNACSIQNRTKVKIKKWLEVPNLTMYEEYLEKWHELLKELRKSNYSDEEHKNICMLLLNYFYVTDFSIENFYDEFGIAYNKGTLLIE